MFADSRQFRNLDEGSAWLLCKAKNSGGGASTSETLPPSLSNRVCLLDGNLPEGVQDVLDNAKDKCVQQLEQHTDTVKSKMSEQLPDNMPTRLERALENLQAKFPLEVDQLLNDLSSNAKPVSSLREDLDELLGKAGEDAEELKEFVKQRQEFAKGASTSRFDTFKTCTKEYANRVKQDLSDLWSSKLPMVKTCLPDNVVELLDHLEQADVTRRVVSFTRKNLLDAEEEDSLESDTEVPPMHVLVEEVAQAATSGVLFENTLTLSEQLVETKVGPLDVLPEDQRNCKSARVVNLTRTISRALTMRTGDLVVSGLCAMQAWFEQGLDAVDNLIRTRMAPFADRFGTPILSRVQPMEERFRAHREQ